MLPKVRRLTSAEVKTVLLRGRGKRGPLLSVKMYATQTPFRCAVVVSKKVAKTAVLRNRVRRSVYRALQKASLPPTGHAILFVQSVPKTDASEVFSSELSKLLHV